MKRRFVRRASYLAFLVASSLAGAELCAPLVMSALRGDPASRQALRQELFGSAAYRSRDAVAGGTQTPGWMAQHVLHPYYGFARNPEIERQIFNQRVIDEPVNRYGFFGALDEGASGDFRVVVAGGSLAAELYLYGGGRLRERLDGSGALPGERKATLASVALGGFKQPQQLLALTYLLAVGERYDVVINLDGFNEGVLPFAENAPLGVFPWYPRSWRLYAAGSVARESTVLLGEIAYLRDQTETWKRSLFQSPLRHSYLALAVLRTRVARQENRIRQLDGELRAVLAGRTAAFRETGPPYSYEDDGRLFADSASLWKRTSQQMWSACRSRGVRYLHFLQPNQYVAGSKVFTADETRTAFLPPDHRYRRGVERSFPLLRAAGEELAAEGVPFTDLTQLFLDEPRTVYRDHCCHLNQLGYDRLADAIADAILAQLRSDPEQPP
jgi:hypothetical protein